MTTAEGKDPDADLDRHVRAVMHTAQALVGIVVSSLGEVDGGMSVAQLRVLAIVGTQGPLNVNALASAARVHPSNATRACDPLVARGLLARQESSTDRRRVDLTITDRGRNVLSSVMRHREAAIARILSRMPAALRSDFVVALESFTDAAGEVVDDSLWQWNPSLG
jgi:DNA-binding MarR family transcriptional regulator